MTIAPIATRPQQEIILPGDASLSTHQDDKQPWDRLPGEDTMWYSRFVHYYLPLGSSRSLLGAYNQYRLAQTDLDVTYCTSESWRINAHKYDWEKRATAYDDWKRDEFQQRMQVLALEVMEERVSVARDLLKVAHGKLFDTDISWSSNSVANAIKTALHELRTDLPISQSGGRDIQIVVKNLPQNLRLAILAAVDGE
jgi:hypothetical protein